MNFFPFMMKVFGWLFLAITIAAFIAVLTGAIHQIFIFTAAGIMTIGCFTDKQEELE